MEFKMFKCDRCGQCCKNISISPIYQRLNRGDGVCLYFDEKYSLCTIYKNRPIECNVDAMYDAFFSNIMTKNEYYKLNYASCKKLKNLK